MNAVPITQANLWKHLLENVHLLNFGKFSTGFTIPFIVGAYYKRGFLNDEEIQTSKCIQVLIEQILENSPQGQELCLFKCVNSEKLILQYLIVGNRDINEISQIKQKNMHINHTIYLDLYEFSHVTTLDKLIEVLWEKYQNPISTQNFSYDGTWKPFTDDEIQFIQSL